MKGYLVNQAGGPEVLKLKEIPDPVAVPGQVHIQIKAFGLNRAEAVTRMGGSGKQVVFPKIIGIECVGVVLDCPGREYALGQTVAAAMGGMGRKYNGSYAEQTVVPATNVFPLNTTLDWTTLAALPETYFTAWGCCFESLQIQQGAHIVMRPGASALGIAVTQIVNHLGGKVIGVTRSPGKREKLLRAGMLEVIVSDGAIADQVKAIWPNGATGIIDTIASDRSVSDDMNMLAPGGRLCLAGSLAESYATANTTTIADAFKKPAVGFYSSETISVEKNGPILQQIINRVETAVYQPHIDAVFDFDELPAAHASMDANLFAGKVVIKTNV